MNCRLCNSGDLTRFLDLGHTPPADDFLVEDRLHLPETHYPLGVLSCNSCGFVQLDHVVDPTILYQNDYPYEASMTLTGQDHFSQFARQVINLHNIPADSLVIDIGSNVGVLLRAFKNESMRVLGIDPADNIAEKARANGIPTISDFINPELAKNIISEHGKARVITGSNVFAHIDDLNELMTSLGFLLDDKGMFVIEVPHLLTLLENLEYDTIYHEHLSYVSVTPLIPFFKKHGLEIFDVHPVSIHGGSLRIFVARQDRYAITDNVSMLLDQEKEKGIHEISCLENFASRVSQHRDELTWLLHSLKREGKRIAGISAPAKGMTLLNYCKIGTETLEFLTEKSSLKVGRYAPGNHLPIFPDKALVENDIDYALVLAWNFKDEIMRNQPEFVEKGGKFIIPIPKPVIVG